MINNEKGSVTVIFVILLTLIVGVFGFAVDFGYGILQELKLSNALDAASLAGGQELKETEKAREVANEYLIKNGVNPEDVTITFSDDNKSIRLESSKIVENRFIKVLGNDFINIEASAKVQINPIVGMYNGVRPFGVEETELVFGQEVILKEASQSDPESGNFGGLSFGGETGASIFKDNTLYGYQGVLEVGDIIATEPGNMSSVINPVRQLLMDDYNTFDNYSEDSIRLWVIPIIKNMDYIGRSDVEIVGFGQFFIESIGKQGGQTTITGRFIKRVGSGISGSSQEDYGLYSTKLIE